MFGNKTEQQKKTDIKNVVKTAAIFKTNSSVTERKRNETTVINI